MRSAPANIPTNSSLCVDTANPRVRNKLSHMLWPRPHPPSQTVPGPVGSDTSRDSTAPGHVNKAGRQKENADGPSPAFSRLQRVRPIKKPNTKHMAVHGAEQRCSISEQRRVGLAFRRAGSLCTRILRRITKGTGRRARKKVRAGYATDSCIVVHGNTFFPPWPDLAYHVGG